MSIKRLGMLIALFLLFQLGYGQPSGMLETQPEEAIEATLKLFDTYPVVGIGEAHSIKELGDFYVELVRNPAFARVGNVVFEFGNSFFQPIVDRYIAGEEVSYEEVKKAWTTTVAAGGPHEVSVMYGQFYEAVREVNQTLPDAKKIKIWLGDPPADPNNSMDYSDLNFPDRDAFFAETVLREILAKNKKALLIIGAGHFMSGGMSATVSELENSEPYQYNVKAFIDAYYPNKLFIIQNHWGMPELACNEVLEARLEQWTSPHLTLLQNTPLADFLNSPECNVDNVWGELARAWGDAYLYLGKSDALTLSPLPGEPEKPYLEELLRDAPELKERE